MDKIINAYTDNEDLIKALVDFIEMRRKKKKPLTERALILFLNRMDDMLETDELKIEALNDSVCNSWSTVYDKRIINYDNSKGKEMVNHPSHYNQGIEAIDYIESHKMNFNIGNVIKYVTRAKHKGTELEDLKKASWYLNREIERLEKGE